MINLETYPRAHPRQKFISFSSLFSLSSSSTWNRPSRIQILPSLSLQKPLSQNRDGRDDSVEFLTTNRRLNFEISERKKNREGKNEPNIKKAPNRVPRVIPRPYNRLDKIARLIIWAKKTTNFPFSRARGKEEKEGERVAHLPGRHSVPLLRGPV